MAETLGYIGALFIGIVLGITGGGGSILTVPILVYMLNYNPIIATAYSLFIVGTTSGFGTVQNFKKGLVDPKIALQFALPSILGVYITRKYIITSIPFTIANIGSYTLSKDTFLMLLFATVMILASYSMLKKQSNNISEEYRNKSIWIVIQLFFVGILIGLIGAGGGFLIIPALIKLANLPIKKAIGTSLLIITLNSLIGFLGDVQNIFMEWSFLLKFTSIAVIGIFIGLYLQSFINDKILKKIFGIFVLIMSLLIIIKELFLNNYKTR